MSKTTHTISLKQARKLAMHTQLLDQRTKFPSGVKGLHQIIDHMGYIQIDTISVIARAHHHTLYNRLPGYTPNMLDQLMSDRKVFEYWGHAASFLPMDDYRFYLPRMRWFRDPSESWFRNALKMSGHLLKPVMKRIREEGALSSHDFLNMKDNKSVGLWSFRPARMALEMLMWQGQLMVTKRVNFRRYYDLTERVLPDNVNTKYPTKNEMGQFLVDRALRAHGIATRQHIVKHIGNVNKQAILDSLDTMLENGDIVEVKIKEIPDHNWFSYPSSLEKISHLRQKKSSALILSPFDNSVINRDRLSLLFGLDYKIECYVPAAKRVHGYFVLPIYWNGHFIARLDAKADRKPQCFIIRTLAFESEVKITDPMLKAIADSLKSFAIFNNCTSYDFEYVLPKKYIAQLKKLLSQ